MSRLVRGSLVLAGVTVVADALARPAASGSAQRVVRMRPIPPDTPEPSGPPCVSTGRLTDHGGPVVYNPQVVTVFWGPQVDPATRSRIDGFYSTLTRSNYFDWLSEYSPKLPALFDAFQGLLQDNRVRYSGSYTVDPPPSDGILQDQTLQEELAQQIASGKLPPPDPSRIYMLYFPPRLDLMMGDGSQSCRSFCGYHGSFDYQGQKIRYAVIPDLGQAGCSHGGCGIGPSTFDNVTSVSSHELVETITDPDGSAWFDNCGAEIGDRCNHQHSSLDGYTVQREWDNLTRSCIATAADRSAHDPPGSAPGGSVGGELGGGVGGAVGPSGVTSGCP